jgi:hypothetical protein
MTHPTYEYEDAILPSEQDPAPQTANVTVAADVMTLAPAQPANENVAPRVPFSGSEPFEASAEESFRIAPPEKLEELQNFYAAGTEAYETISHAVRASFEEVAAGLGQFNTKLIEFGQINAQNNMAFAQSVAGVRSVRDAVDVQTAYLREQYDAAATQIRELQALTTEIAEKASAPLKQQFMRSTQMFRSC